MGEKIEDLVGGFMEPGIYSIPFNGKNIASGTYIYKLTADNFVKTKKMILIK
jgi:hypothetical protein